MTDEVIPQWALDEAVKQLNVGQYHHGTCQFLYYTCDMHSAQVLARMIVKHEKPPVDPDEQVVMRVLWAAFPHVLICSEAKARALAQYKKEIGHD